MPSGPTAMMRSLEISVKYTVPSRSTVGPSVNATVVTVWTFLETAERGATVVGSGEHAGKSKAASAPLTMRVVVDQDMLPPFGVVDASRPILSDATELDRNVRRLFYE